MDHGEHGGMDMSATTTGMASEASASAADSSGHDMGNGCKISMLLNYNTIDVGIPFFTYSSHDVTRGPELTRGDEQ